MKSARSVLVVLLAFFVCAPLWSQANRGNIQGQVQDPQNAAIPGAHLKLTNVATGVVLQTNSEPSGNFSFQDLSAGTYELTCEIEGFQKYVQ